MIFDRVLQRPNSRVRSLALLRLFLLFSLLACALIEAPATVFQFSPWGKVGPASGWTFLEGDFTGNGNVSELVGYSPTNGTLWVGRNTGSGFAFSQWAVVSPASGWKFVAGHFTNSFRTDLLGYSPTNGTLWVGKSTGSSFTFSQWGVVSPATGWSFAAGLFSSRSAGSNTGTDIMAYYQGDGSVWVGKNLGTGFSFSKWATVSPAAGWTFMAGPFTQNADFQDDIAGYFQGNGTLWVGKNTGSSFAFSRWGIPS